MDIMPQQQPEADPRDIEAEVELTFRWFERLRIALGRPVTVKLTSHCQHPPGLMTDARAEVVVVPIGGGR
jgi:hypothetical protein